jgi:hypothetical protein
MINNFQQFKKNEKNHFNIVCIFFIKDISAQESWSQNTSGITSSVSIDEFKKTGDNLYTAGTFTDTKTFISEISLFK